MFDSFEKFFRALDWMDALVLAALAFLTALLIVVTPPLLALQWFREHHYTAAGTAILLWLVAALSMWRDWIRQKLSPITGFLLVVWIIGTLAIWWRLETA